VIRTRVRALLSLADALALRLDAYVAAVLDVRPIRSWGVQAAAWLGAEWRAHLSAARIRRHGPGRGVTTFVVNRPSAPNEESSREC
jgi:hypothetical protein